MLRPFARPRCMLLRVVAQSLKPVKIFSQQLLTFLLFRDRRSVAQQCWILLHSSSNIVGATHAHYAWFTKTYGLYPSPDALQVPKLFGVVASVCTPLPTRTQQLPTLLAQQCWELFRPFARSLKLDDSFRLLFTYRWVVLPTEYRYFTLWNAPMLTFSLVLHFACPLGFIWNGIVASTRILLWLTLILFSFNGVLLFGLNLIEFSSNSSFLKKSEFHAF